MAAANSWSYIIVLKCGALRDHFFSTRDVSERLKGKIYTGGVLAVLLYGCESWCLTAESISRLRNWHNKRIREMCRVTMCQSFVHQISSASLQKRTGVFSIEYYLASRTLLWAGHVARMPRSWLPQKAHAFVGTRAEDSGRSRDDLL